MTGPNPTNSKPRNPKLDDSKRAVGALLGFYRRIRRLSQRKLADEAGTTEGVIAMAESGRRLPPAETVAPIAQALGLNPFQTRQLELLVEYPHRLSRPGFEWFNPDDVKTGTPMFLRNLDKEAKFQTQANIAAMWIVTDRPLAVREPMKSVLRDRLRNESTEFVYFLDSSLGERPFQDLWSLLASELPATKETVAKRLKCVLTPASFCLYHFAICNPGDDREAMFGRAIFYSAGRAVGYAAMDSDQVDRAYRLLDPSYRICEASPGQEVPTEYGKFRLVQPA
ncbi:MAG TPA: helix-turn-helix transcriptional regulator [Bryobacteraceae bacterium]|nr:helix-turn-helix transcriptional regulator [Bryobacteraceae bacterium]